MECSWRSIFVAKHLYFCSTSCMRYIQNCYCCKIKELNVVYKKRKRSCDLSTTIEFIGVFSWARYYTSFWFLRVRLDNIWWVQNTKKNSKADYRIKKNPQSFWPPIPQKISYGRHWGVVRRAMIWSFRISTWKVRRVRNSGVTGFGLELKVKTV